MSKELEVILELATSKLIALWYRRFCMEKERPVPSFKTFCQLMRKHDFNFDQSMEYYKKNFSPE